MNFTTAAEWIYQNPVDDGIIVTLAVAAVLLGRRAYKAHRESYRPSEQIVERFLSRPQYTGKLPPRADRRSPP